MPRAYSLDRRERAMSTLGKATAPTGGVTRRLCGLSGGPKVVKLPQRLRATGSVVATGQIGTPGHTLQAERDVLLGRIAAHPSMTARALAAELAAQGVHASQMAPDRQPAPQVR